MTFNEITFLILAIVISLEIGALAAYLIENRKYTKLRDKYTQALTALEYERKTAEH